MYSQRLHGRSIFVIDLSTVVANVRCAHSHVCSASVDEATHSVATLTALVHQLLSSNQEIATRLVNLEGQIDKASGWQRIYGDDGSTIVKRGRGSAIHRENDDFEDPRFAFEFDHDLYRSWVYARALRRHSSQSLTSSLTNSFRWSCLSNISLADISNLSVLSLPIRADELRNSVHYGTTKRARSSLQTSYHSQRDAITPQSIQLPATAINLGVIRTFGRALTPRANILLMGTSATNPDP